MQAGAQPRLSRSPVHIATALQAPITYFFAAEEDAGPPDEDAKSKLVAAPRDLRSLPEAVGMFWKFLDDDRAAVGVLSAVSSSRP